MWGFLSFATDQNRDFFILNSNLLISQEAHLKYDPKLGYVFQISSEEKQKIEKVLNDLVQEQKQIEQGLKRSFKNNFAKMSSLNL